MKRCLGCSRRFDASADQCPDCGNRAAKIDGVTAYAPALAHEGEGFKAEYFSDLAALEAGNFWFRARNDLILWALEKYSPQMRSMLEIGCGTGFVLSGVARRFPDAALYGSEVLVSGLGFAAARVPKAEFMQMDARDIPYAEEFDVIGAFDVIEHIEEDERVIEQAAEALKPGGLLALTVPQHAWLWSAADEYACHVRRYSAGELRRKIEAAGFRVLRSTSFVSTLLPAMWLSRFARKKTPGPDFDALAELRLAPALNALFYRALRGEMALIRGGVDLPLGGSRLLLARKAAA